MRRTILADFCMIFFCTTVICGGNQSLSDNIIRITPDQWLSGVIRSQSYFVKQQQPITHVLQGASLTFVKVPGLTLPFYHAEPLLYKISFEGRCYSNHAADIFLYLRLIIDDYLLYVNKFIPNTADRYKYFAGFDANHFIDSIGGWNWFTSSQTLTMCSFSDIIYLNPGLHVIDVGVRGGYDTGIGAFPLYVNAGILRIEVIQFHPPANIGLMPVNVTLTTS